MKQTVVLLLLSASLAAQGGFGPQQIISTAAEDASSVHAADLNGDGFVDVISASAHDDKIAWYENLFPPTHFTYAASIDAATQGVTVNLTLGQPFAPYFMFQSNSPLNGIAPGTGWVAGLHISPLDMSRQLAAGLAGDPLFGGNLDCAGRLSITMPGLAAVPFLSGQTFWGLGIQALPFGVYEPSNISSLVFP